MTVVRPITNGLLSKSEENYRAKSSLRIFNFYAMIYSHMKAVVDLRHSILKSVREMLCTMDPDPLILEGI